MVQLPRLLGGAGCEQRPPARRSIRRHRAGGVLKPAPLAATAAGIADWSDAGRSGAFERLLPGAGPLEVELGFGKGRYLLSRAAACPERRFLGVEVAGEYFRLVAQRLARKRLANVVLLCGDALALLATALPRRAIERLHVYFPDPWPKSRHARRRLLSPASLDLLIGAVADGGSIEIATDHVAYGAEVARLLAAAPSLEVERHDAGWPEGPRTNYEAKYVVEGRPIIRFSARIRSCRSESLHREGLREVACAFDGAERELSSGDPDERERA